MKNVTEDLVGQNGNQAAAVMAGYAAQGGGGSEIGLIPESNYVRVQENGALAYIGENGETMFTFEPIDVPRRLCAVAVDTSSHPEGIAVYVASGYNLSTQENVEKAYKSMINGFAYTAAAVTRWVKPTAFDPWNPTGFNTMLTIEITVRAIPTSITLYWGRVTK